MESERSAQSAQQDHAHDQGGNVLVRQSRAEHWRVCVRDLADADPVVDAEDYFAADVEAGARRAAHRLRAAHQESSPRHTRRDAESRAEECTEHRRRSNHSGLESRTLHYARCLCGQRDHVSDNRRSEANRTRAFQNHSTKTSTSKNANKQNKLSAKKERKKKFIVL